MTSARARRPRAGARRGVAIALGALSLACGGPPAGRSAAPAAGTFGVVPGPVRPGEWFASAPRETERAGATESRVLATEAAIAGDRVTVLLEAPHDDCVLLIARATEGIDDIDLFAFGDDGATLGVDEGQDKTPSLMLCPPRPRRIFTAVRVVNGRGMVALGAQRVPVALAARIGAAVGARGRPGETPPAGGPWAEIDTRLDAHRRRLGGRWQDVRRAVVPIDARSTTRVSAVVEAGRCLDVLMLPADEVAQAELLAEDAGGRVLGRARVTGRDRWMVLCARERTPVTLALRPYQGAGFAALALSASAPGADRDVDAVAVRLGRSRARTLEEARQQADARATATGLGAARALASGKLLVGSRRGSSLDLPTGCVRLEVVTAEPVRALEAWLWHADGALGGRARGDGDLTLFSCGERRAARLDLESTVMPGDYALALREEPGSAPALAAEPVAAGRLLGRAFELGLLGRVADLAVERHAVSAERRLRVEREVPARRCLAVVVGLGAGAAGVDLRLLDGSEQELGRGHGGQGAAARHCAGPAAQRVLVEVGLLAGAAPALVGSRLEAP